MDDTVGRESGGGAASEDAPVERAPGDEVPADAPEPAETSLRTFLIADIRGYTSYTEEHGDEAATALASRFAALVREVVEGRQGFLLELRGDEALAVFVSARQALKAANEIQRRQEIDALPRTIGIGLDAGEAIPFEGGFRGSALNLAARLCAQAGPGQIVASEAVIHLAARVDGLAYIEPRTLRLKGLDEPVRAVTVVPEGRAPKRRRQTGGGPRIERRGLLAAGAIGVAALAVATLAWAGPLGGLGGGSSATPVPSTGAGEPPTPHPSLVAGASAIDPKDLPFLAFLDPTNGAITDSVSTVGRPVEATYADGAFWVLDLAPRSVHRIDPTRHEDTLQIPIGFEEGWFTAGGGRVWVSEFGTSRIHEFDEVSGRELRVLDITRTGFVYQGIEGLSFGDGSLWVSKGLREVVRLDPASGEVQTSISTDAIRDVEYADGAAWVMDGWRGQVVRIDAATNKVTGNTDDLGRITALEVGGGYAWAALPDEGTVIRVDDAFRTKPFATGDGVEFLGFDESSGVLWTGNYNDGSVSRIDSVTGDVDTYTIGHAIQPVAAGGGQVLVGVAKGPEDIVAELEGSVLRLASDATFEENDPAIGWPTDARIQLEQAMCARLLDYPASADGGGTQLQPSVAVAMPDVSADGRTYTFQVRPGFAFSPPSTEPLTAETYRYSIERSMSPSLGGDDLAPGYRFLPDIRGALEFHAGQTEHVEGLRVDGDRLIIDLVKPSGSFLRRLWLPTFCPVPLGTPAVQGGINDPPIARAGPYYISNHFNNEVTILERNPNYPGPLQPTFDAIAWYFETNLGRAVGRVERGELDWTMGFGPEVQPGGRIDQAWGGGSTAAAAGDQRLFRPVTSGVDFFAVNPGSTTLADPTVRRAVALALDRRVPAEKWGDPTDEVLPLTMPGIVTADRYPLDGARPDEAKALLGGRSVSLRIAWISRTDCADCGEVADAMKRDLAAAGIEATFEESDWPAGFAAGRDTGFDMAVGWTYLEYPDAADWLRHAFTDAFPREWPPDGADTELTRIEGLSGTEHDAAAGSLADKLATELDIIPFDTSVAVQFVSQRLGCLTFRQPYPYLDLVSACLD